MTYRGGMVCAVLCAILLSSCHMTEMSSVTSSLITMDCSDLNVSDVMMMITFYVDVMMMITFYVCQRDGDIKIFTWRKAEK